MILTCIFLFPKTKPCFPKRQKPLLLIEADLLLTKAIDRSQPATKHATPGYAASGLNLKRFTGFRAAQLTLRRFLCFLFWLIREDHDKMKQTNNNDTHIQAS